MPDNTHTEDEEYQAYQFIQEVIFWFNNPKSKHYSKESYGSSFNTDAFCKEMVRNLVAMQSTARQEAYERGRGDCLRVKPEEKSDVGNVMESLEQNYINGFNAALHDWQQAIEQLTPQQWEMKGARGEQM